MKLSCRTYFTAFLILLTITLSLPVTAQSITGFGYSETKGGTAINRELATAAANAMLSDQAKVAQFVYQRKSNELNFTQQLRAEISQVKKLRTETIGQHGVAIWLQASVSLPKYPEERCQFIKRNLTQTQSSQDIFASLWRETIPKLIKRETRTHQKVQGISYARELEVNKSMFGGFQLKTQLCVAKISSE
ncbi:MAG: hypothetical protein OEZ43_10365 [Gammaproteobacteria bacterium]|nr:hypothetical protein [Gammaproteobacteria bacterium]